MHIWRSTKYILTCWALLLFLQQGAGQTSNISGVVNTYHQVIEIFPSKSCLRVSNPAGLTVNKMVMILQMKGASISTANNSSFGDTTSLNGAGFYEVGTICYIIGDSIFLFHDLLNNYDVNEKVQLVQFAEYYSADVVDTVKAQPWDSAAGTGGVIAIYADQDITLTKPIWADSSGYLGGSYLLSSGTCSNIFPATGYAYTGSNNNPQSGAYKGEGVTNPATNQTGGRGAPANGGGGGNNHNNSGGGGANLSAGGIGGGNSSSLGCNTTIRGLGGKALDNWQGAKIFAGGGGGAGHSNNGFSSVHGGRGGGIIFLWANQLIGNNEYISARGAAGGSSLSDGAGGGGAGGTIIMNVTNYSGNAILRTDGGQGGNSADGGTAGRCYGGGGGGSGGVVYFSGPTPVVTVSIAAGNAGVESGRDAGCVAAQAAGAGSTGVINPNYSFRRSTNPAGYCQLLLPVGLIYFRAVSVQQSVLLNWETDDPGLLQEFILEKKNNAGDWTYLSNLTVIDTRNKYSYADLHPSKGYNYYRLRLMEKNGSISYSPIRQIWFASADNGIDIYPNPASGEIIINGNFDPAYPVQITDIAGRIILETRISSSPSRISLPSLPAGLYLIRYRNFSKKLIIR
ncbi:MAG: T9SS type A sorting domain-containing protein [Chitinophagaceae bacterium]|nr:T9SS type A sorting domain-containing protein [Chitinophagaceae bacterium]